jgi:hypothetical protein
MHQGNKKKKGSQGKRGGQDHFVGFKLEFLESRALEYQQGLDIGNPGPFYDKVSLDFLAKFGQDDDFAKEPSEDPPDPWDLAGDIEGVEDEVISEGEAKERTARYNKLRQVSQENNLYFKSILTSPCRNSVNGIVENISAPRPLAAPTLPVTHSYQYSMQIRARPRENSPHSTSISNFITIPASKPNIVADISWRRMSSMLLRRTNDWPKS